MHCIMYGLVFFKNSPNVHVVYCWFYILEEKEQTERETFYLVLFQRRVCSGLDEPWYSEGFFKKAYGGRKMLWNCNQT